MYKLEEEDEEEDKEESGYWAEHPTKIWHTVLNKTAILID